MNNNVNHPAHYTAGDSELPAVTSHLRPYEKKILECLVRSASKSGDAAEEDYQEAIRHARRIAYNEGDPYEPDAAGIAIGRIIRAIAASTLRGSTLWQDVFDAAIRLSDEQSKDISMNNKEKKMDDRVDLTIGGLMRELQALAFRYGNDTPVVIHTTADADYEQATAPIIIHARRETVPDDWDLFHIDPYGKPVAVIS